MTRRPRTCRPAGTSGTRSVDPSTYRFWGYTLNENGLLNTYGLGRNPIFYSTDFYSQRAVDLIARNAPAPAALLPLGRLPRPARRRPARARRSARHQHPRRCAAPPRPLRRHPAAVHPRLQRGDVSDKPAHIRALPRIGPGRARRSRRTTSSGSSRCSPWTRGSPASSARCGARASWTTRSCLHLGQRLLPRRAPGAGRQGARLRALDPRAAHPARSRACRRTGAAASSSPTPTSPRRSWTPPARGPGRTQDGRSLFGLLDDPRREWGRDLLVEGGGVPGEGEFDALRTYRYVYANTRPASASCTTSTATPTSSRAATPTRPTRSCAGGWPGGSRALKTCAGSACRTAAACGCGVRGCRARVSGSGIESVDLPQDATASARAARPSAPLVAGRRLRARVTHDRRPGRDAGPTGCRAPAASSTRRARARGRCSRWRSGPRGRSAAARPGSAPSPGSAGRACGPTGSGACPSGGARRSSSMIRSTARK